jgi:hypothetical protein
MVLSLSQLNAQLVKAAILFIWLQGGCEALLKAMDDMVVALAPLSFKAPVAFV